jgi:hypothetical protein
VQFSRHRGTVRAELDAVEAQVLADLAGQLLSLVEPPALGDDPLAALVGMSGSEVPAPDDPVLARLLPDAYRDDPEAAGDFRRFTDAELRARKRADAQHVLASLPADGGRLALSRDDVDRWLGFVNDARLALGTVLGVSDDTDPEEADEDDPAYQAMQVYSWLGWLQESLLSCVEPRPHGG